MLSLSNSISYMLTTKQRASIGERNDIDFHFFLDVDSNACKYVNGLHKNSVSIPYNVTLFRIVSAPLDAPFSALVRFAMGLFSIPSEAGFVTDMEDCCLDVNQVSGTLMTRIAFTTNNRLILIVTLEFYSNLMY